MLGYDKLMNYYKTNFGLMQYHKYSLSEVESMLPWERMIYINLLSAYLKEQEEKQRDQAALIRANNKRR